MTPLRKVVLTVTILLAYAIAKWYSGPTVVQLFAVDVPVSAEHTVAATLPPFTGPVDDPARLAAAAPLHLDLPALFHAFGGANTWRDSGSQKPFTVRPGDETTFWVSDTLVDEPVIVTATLRYAGTVVLMYVDNQIAVDQEVLEDAARTFESDIYPHTRSLFGSEDVPGVDGDRRLTILHTTLQGAGGYYSRADAATRQINRYSNERDMFVIGVDSYPVGSDAYLATLAHEFQHMIHAHQQPHGATWFNEALSGLSQDLNGYADNALALIHLNNPDIGLLSWSTDAARTGEHYGTGQLFLRYFHEQYVADGDLKHLLRADAGDQLDAFVHIAARKRSDIKDFATLFADWVVANLVNDPEIGDGRYAYSGLPAYVALNAPQPGKHMATVNQFGADYLGILEGPLTLSFNGREAVSLTGASPPEGDWMWWSLRGDAQISTLTRAFDLRRVERATLQFSAWYAIERHFDYAYVTVSADGGKTWSSLPGKTTTQEDPQAANLGHGLTGVSGQADADIEDGLPARWVEERIDLTPYAGREILLRFWLANDSGLSADGLLIDNIRIPEINYTHGAEQGDGGWEARGFVRTTGGLPQTWELRLVREHKETLEVEEVALDDQAGAQLRIPAGERAVLVVTATTPFASDVAVYEYEISSP